MRAEPRSHVNIVLSLNNNVFSFSRAYTLEFNITLIKVICLLVKPEQEQN